METGYVDKIKKGWGYEIIFTDTSKYCGKILHFNKDGKSSMHFHKLKDETWYVHTGRFTYKEIDTNDGNVRERKIKSGDVVIIRPFTIHQLIALENGEIFEVSTHDHSSDSYRVWGGDSQK